MSVPHVSPAAAPLLLDEYRRLVDDRLPEEVLLPPDCPESLRESIEYSLLAGGKRLRPVLVLMACEACGGDPEAALPAAVAIEMVHTYSLIHDDLPAMDDDDLRRGRPTNHKRFGEATAILAGDALLTRAFEVLAIRVHPPETAAACCADLASAAGPCGMVGGQQADLEAEGRIVGHTSGVPTGSTGSTAPSPDDDPAHRRCAPRLDLESLESVHRRKTGRLIECALVMGGRIAGANDETLSRLEIYGSRVGLAFQIADDLLDVTGDEDRMGKGVRKDADLGKLTYPSLLGEAESRRRARDLIDEAREAIAPLGERAHGLDELARFVLERDH